MGTRAEARRYPTKRATTNKRIFGRKNTEREGFGFRSFCWHKRPAARARGFCLSAGERPPKTKTSLRLSNPCDTKQLVSHLSFLWKLKTPLMRGLKFPRRGRDLNPRSLAAYRFSRPAVSTTHTPLPNRYNIYIITNLLRLRRCQNFLGSQRI